MRRVGLWKLFGFAASTLLGTILHFLYDWLGKPLWIAPFSGVNESTFEHMKLLFWPMLIYALTEWMFFKKYTSFPCVKLRGILIGISLIPTVFYSYQGIIGKSSDVINIAIFFISAAAAYFYEWRALKRETVACKHPKLAVILLCFLASLFVLFTFVTPKIGIFLDPITGTYGI